MRIRVLYILRILIFSAGFIVSSGVIYGQKPPRPLTINKTRDLAFGAFYQGAAGGSVSVNASGIRSKSGDIVLMGMGYPVSSAVFNIRGNPGTLVTIMLGPDVALPGSNGGSMNLHLDPNTIPVSPFVLTGGNPATKDLYLGGTLTVGAPAANPPGTFSGIFTITFNQN